jgi:hypothetical protein
VRSATARLAPLGSLLAAAATVGIAVGLVARAFASGSCPAHDSFVLLSSCRGLVSSLALRVGVAAGVAVLLMQLIATGLSRTAEAMEEERRILEEEDGRPADAPTG